MSFPFCFLLLRHHFISFNFISFHQGIWKYCLGVCSIKWGRKITPGQKVLIKTLHRYRNRKACFDLNSVIWEKLYPGGFGSSLAAPCQAELQKAQDSMDHTAVLVFSASLPGRSCFPIYTSCTVFPRKLEHFVSKALFHDKVSCTIRKGRSWRVAAWEGLSHIHPWGWCSSKGCERQEARPVQCYWEKSCWQDKWKNRDRISSYLGPPFLALASTSLICTQILGKLTVHEDFLQKSLQKHDAVMVMDGCFYSRILTYLTTERKITVNVRSYLFAQETAQTGGTLSDISCRSCLQKVWQKGKTHVMPHLANFRSPLI